MMGVVVRKRRGAKSSVNRRVTEKKHAETWYCRGEAQSTLGSVVQFAKQKIRGGCRGSGKRLNRLEKR